MQPKYFTLMLSSALAMLPASAQSMKPGLWETTARMTSGTGETAQMMEFAQQQMANIPDQQRKMLEGMMSRQGMSVSLGGPEAGTRIKMCMTKEMVERNTVPLDPNGDCKASTAPISGGILPFSFTCNQPPSSGEGSLTFQSETAYTMKMRVRATLNGKANQMESEGSGTWLGADCGAIKAPGAAQKRG
jgi:hypothetical protein